jgi:hypothetical protein
MDFHTFSMCWRLLVAGLGFVNMWVLWRAREKRGESWTPKLRHIWQCMLMFTVLATEAHIELFYRRVDLTFGGFLIAFVFMLSIYAGLRNENYTKDQR